MADTSMHLPREVRQLQADILRFDRYFLTFVGLPLCALNALPVHIHGGVTPALWVESIVFPSAALGVWLIRNRSQEVQAAVLITPILLASILSVAQWGPSFGSGILQMAVLSIIFVFFQSSVREVVLLTAAVLAANALLAVHILLGWIPTPDPRYLDATVPGNWVRVFMTPVAALPVAGYVLFRILRSTEDAWKEAEARFVRLEEEQTARENTQVALEKAQRMEIVGRLASGLSHDFNNTLTVGVGVADLLEKRATDERDRELIAEIVRAAETAADLSTRLLVFSRQEKKKPRPVDLGSLLPRLQKSLRRLLPSEIRISVRSEAALWACVDPAQLDQAILNLCLNARDAMPQGGQLTLLAADQLLEGNPGLALSMEDTGTGIDEKVQEWVFEPFFSTKAEGKGTGLGLVMVREMVSRHGGRIDLASTPGEGTRVTLVLPAWEGDEINVVQGVDERAEVSGSILLLDDDPQVRRTLVRILEDDGHRVSAFGTAEETLSMLAGGASFDLLITDNAPVPEGSPVVDRFQTSFPLGRILFLTGYGQETLEEKGLLIPAARLAMKLSIRMALGAEAAQVLGLVLRQGMVLVGVGAVLGIGGAYLTARGLSALFFGVSPLDPTVYGWVTVVLLAVALAANLVPAKRASRTEPMRALRES